PPENARDRTAPARETTADLDGSHRKTQGSSAAVAAVPDCGDSDRRCGPAYRPRNSYRRRASGPVEREVRPRAQHMRLCNQPGESDERDAPTEHYLEPRRRLQRRPEGENERRNDTQRHRCGRQLTEVLSGDEIGNKEAETPTERQCQHDR